MLLFLYHAWWKEGQPCMVYVYHGHPIFYGNFSNMAIVSIKPYYRITLVNNEPPAWGYFIPYWLCLIVCKCWNVTKTPRWSLYYRGVQVWFTLCTVTNTAYFVHLTAIDMLWHEQHGMACVIKAKIRTKKTKTRFQSWAYKPVCQLGPQSQIEIYVTDACIHTKCKNIYI